MILETKKISYDTLNPDKNLTDFLSFLRSVKMRYEGNAREQEEKEAQLQDVEHYAELHDDLDIRRGFIIYKQFRDTRRERRKMKCENELLLPLYEWMEHNEQALNSLKTTLGEVRKKAELIDKRKYMARTDVLEGGIT